MQSSIGVAIEKGERVTLSLLKMSNLPGVPGILTFIDKNIEPLIF